MGVWATQLRSEALIEAIAARRCYASEDENTQVKFTVNGQMMGSIIGQAGSASAQIQITVEDQDEPNASYQVRLYYDERIGGSQAQVVENQKRESGESQMDFVHSPAAGGYYFVKLTQDGTGHKDDIWTAPVWIAAEGVPLASAENSDDPQRQEITWREAPNYVGEEVTVSGQLIRAFNYQGKVLFLNFDADYENTLTLVVLQSDFIRFGGPSGIAALQQRLVNKQVTVKGTITLYQNERVQLRLTDPAQIVSVAEAVAPPADE